MPVHSLKTPLIAGRYYHLYNRGNNKERLFFFKGNYNYFLEKYFQYLNPYVDTYCYCLLPNHFHFLIRIRDSETNPRKVSNQFRKLFISYAMKINYQEKRMGCLLSKNFRRIEIQNEDYLKRIVLYIHYNPIKHGVFYDISTYYYSTYYHIIRDTSMTPINAEIVAWFGGLSDFLEKHKKVSYDKKIKRLRLEE
jgi:putative transposase